jgi:CDP-2,3-bis-(O-geranylgeranyl)-sn-glycerol synthase
MTSISVLLLLGVANFTPILVKKLLGDRLAAPLDGGWMLPDGQPLFGPSKTIRGVLASIACTALAAPLLGFDWKLGAILAGSSMLGDLASSFTKRRLRLRVHAQAFGLDQVPEALLPLVVAQPQLGLTAIEIAGIVLAFVILELLLSRVFFELRIREQPY